jgi:hypothetical protein
VSDKASDLLGQLEGLNEHQLRRLLVELLTKQKLGLYWEASAIERDRALNADVVLPRLVEAWSRAPSPLAPISANLPCSSPFKGEVRRGMGEEVTEFPPIPSPALPLKGREKCAGASKLALMPLAPLPLAEEEDLLPPPLAEGRREGAFAHRNLILEGDKYQNRLRVINDDGSLGLIVDGDDLTPVREWLRNTRPMTVHGLDQRVPG